MSTTVVEVRELKEGRYMIVDDEPCKILSITTSKPGKHGAAKARIDVVGLFDSVKRSFVGPVTERVQVPLINKRNAQVLASRGDQVQLMDLETFENFDLPVPEDMRATVQPGKDIVYYEAMGRRMILRL